MRFCLTVYGSDLTATATSLSFNYADPTTGLGAGNYNITPAPLRPLTVISLGSRRVPLPRKVVRSLLNLDSGPTSLSVQLASGSVSGAGDPVIASVSATPVPGALPLFATALGACGLLVWCMKRKNAAALAAA